MTWFGGLAAELRSRPGRFRRFAIVLVSVLAVLASWYSGVPGWIALLLTLLIVGQAARVWRRMPRHRIRFSVREVGALNGHPGLLHGEAVSMFWTALRLDTPDGDCHRALIFRDELDERDFRRLLAHLRHGQVG
ncbi:MAG: protein YgfX [Wenzhouxiangellaceae bacterium]